MISKRAFGIGDAMVVAENLWCHEPDAKICPERCQRRKLVRSCAGRIDRVRPVRRSAGFQPVSNPMPLIFLLKVPAVRHPKGMESFSPGLRGTSYPGCSRRAVFNPARVVSIAV